MEKIKLKFATAIAEFDDNIIEGKFSSYLVSTDMGANNLWELESSIMIFKFPESEKETSKLLQYLKFNELELYNKIQWY